MENDWRLLRGQIQYLRGATLLHQSYQPSDPSNDHDHCEFCMAKFGTGNENLKQGYSTVDRKIWICETCYEDFKEQFEWVVV